MLVIGAWNYPVQLTLLPVVGAIAAGNTVAIRLPSDKYCPNVANAIKSLVEKYLDPECFCCLKGQCEDDEASCESLQRTSVLPLTSFDLA